MTVGLEIAPTSGVYRLKVRDRNLGASPKDPRFGAAALYKGFERVGMRASQSHPLLNTVVLQGFSQREQGLGLSSSWKFYEKCEDAPDI